MMFCTGAFYVYLLIFSDFLLISDDINEHCVSVMPFCSFLERNSLNMSINNECVKQEVAAESRRLLLHPTHFFASVTVFKISLLNQMRWTCHSS